MLGLTPPPGWGTGFDPLALFAGGTYPGFLFDQLDPTRTWTPPGSQLLYQDNGTTVVAASGDTVYLFKDRSGNAKDATQSAFGQRPQWTSAATPYLLFDGANDYLATGLAPASSMTLAACLRATNNSTVAMGAQDTSSHRCHLRLSGTGVVAAQLGSTSALAGTSTLTNNDAVALVRASGGACEVWCNGALELSSTYAGDIAGANGLAIAALNSGGPSNFMPGRIYRAFAIQRWIPDAFVVPLMRWLGAGVVSF